MRIGIPRETLIDEYRVGLLPEHTKQLVQSGHQVFIETDAGTGINVDNDLYKKNGCQIIESSEKLYETSELIVKVKEPSMQECQLITDKHILFAYLHLASSETLTNKLLATKCTAIAYETISDGNELPLLKPMSEIAGQLAIQFGARCLMRHKGGKGILLGGIDSAAPAKVVVIGAGTVGYQAILIAIGLQADVVVMDISLPRLDALTKIFGEKIRTVHANSTNIAKEIVFADMIVGAALIPGAASPILLTKKQLLDLQPLTVLVDVAIDQGGCFESSLPTTHTTPSFVEHNIIHCCIRNLPGCVPVSATQALTAVTFPYIKKLADGGLEGLAHEDGFLNGINVHNGEVTNEALASLFDLPYIKPQTLFNN